MNFFEHRYYKLPKTLMTLVGQWPYQSTRCRIVILVTVIFFNTLHIAPLTAAFLKHRDDQTIIQEWFIIIIFIVCSFAKLTCFMRNSQTTLHLVNRIRTDWRVWSRDRDVCILHEYTEHGRKIIILYTDLTMLRTAMAYSTLFIFIVEPVIPKIIDVLLINGSEQGKFPFPVEYHYFDEQKYYFYIIVCSSVYMCMLCTVSTAGDVMLIVYVQHGCGIFAALGRKLERIGDNVSSTKKRETECALEKMNIVHITSCIDRHNDAIEYANLIETIYAWIFFVIIGLGFIMINLVGLQILVKKNDPKSTIRLIVTAFAMMVLFYIMSYLSQILIDHSDIIRLHIHNSHWYRLSLKAQKLLQFMTMRCNVPCQLTVGKFFVMNMRNFGVTIRTTVSYFATIRSTQKL